MVTAHIPFRVGRRLSGGWLNQPTTSTTIIMEIGNDGSRAPRHLEGGTPPPCPSLSTPHVGSKSLAFYKEAAQSDSSSPSDTWSARLFAPRRTATWFALLPVPVPALVPRINDGTLAVSTCRHLLAALVTSYFPSGCATGPIPRGYPETNPLPSPPVPSHSLASTCVLLTCRVSYYRLEGMDSSCVDTCAFPTMLFPSSRATRYYSGWIAPGNDGVPGVQLPLVRNRACCVR